ncbi:hypothetical protein [Pseudoalteromonas rubra]|uniref:Uncharacterized protein n=1 Tax=Pseudoalteromonas rubra TaxID=43658 RepID=A0A5S3WQ30_9GAMM|nr:hypothetical protein [Pseudoalteromonas rubra]TMP30897.1 hypothetical protein CWB98_23080 [Pseudoalteromonas rubra]
MHPFSLNKQHHEKVAGGFQRVELTEPSLREVGGPIDVTMAIPEDGNDPLPPFFPPYLTK